MQNTKFLDTYNMYIKEASFYGLTIRSSALERYPRIEVEKVIEIRKCNDKDVVTHQKVVILELNNYVLTHLIILDVVVMKVDTILTCFTELVDS
jgi:hypothetical protein